jgi:Tol biopolymer transport system component
MEVRNRFGFTIILMFAFAIFGSCRVPTDDGMPISTTYSELNVVRIDGSGHKVIADGGWEAIPTDSSIIFANGNFKLFKVSYDGLNLTQFYPTILWGDHELSPNGEKILLASGSFEKSGYLSEIYLVNSDGSNLVKLATPKGWYAWPRISPNLDEIVFYRDGGIGAINADGTNFHYIRAKTDSTSCSYAVYLNEDRIVYFEEFNSVHYIRVYDKTTGEDKIVGTNSGGFPAFSRAVVGPNLLIADVGTIKVFNVNTAEVQSLGSGWGASFSSDGSIIVANDGRSIYTMDAFGQNKLMIYSEQDSIKSINNPLFSPDNKYIVFQTMWSVY